MLKGKIELNGKEVDLGVEFSKNEFGKEIVLHFPYGVDTQGWYHNVRVNNDLDKYTSNNTQVEEIENENEINEVINNGHDVYLCPKCHRSVWQIRDESKYCFRCGCKLKWS